MHFRYAKWNLLKREVKFVLEPEQSIERQMSVCAEFPQSTLKYSKNALAGSQPVHQVIYREAALLFPLQISPNYLCQCVQKRTN